MFLESKNFIINRKKGLIEKALFSHLKTIKEDILGKNYSLAINFIPPKEAQNLNIKYREKSYTPNILSFPLSKNEGEIFISLSVARKEAKNFSLSYQNFLRLLVIHGSLHLKGYEHSEKMEALEEKYLKKYMLK